MTSLVIPQKTLNDLMDEDLYLSPTVLNTNSPVFNPLSIFTSGYLNGGYLALKKKQAREEFLDIPEQLDTSADTPEPAPLTVAPSDILPSLLFARDQKIFNDYGNPNQSIHPFHEPKKTKIKTLIGPDTKADDSLFDPNIEPSSSINFKFDYADNNSIFVDSSNNNFNEFLNDCYNEFDDDLSDYESDDDDFGFDHIDLPTQPMAPNEDNEYDFVRLTDLNDMAEPESQDIDMMEVEEVEAADEASDEEKKENDHHCDLINPNTGIPCNKQFSRPYDLIRHQETIHASKKKIFRCVICEGRLNGGKGNGKSKTFSRGDALSRHIKVKHQLMGKEALDLITHAKEHVEYV